MLLLMMRKEGGWQLLIVQLIMMLLGMECRGSGQRRRRRGGTRRIRGIWQAEAGRLHQRTQRLLVSGRQIAAAAECAHTTGNQRREQTGHTDGNDQRQRASVNPGFRLAAQFLVHFRDYLRDRLTPPIILHQIIDACQNRLPFTLRDVSLRQSRWPNDQLLVMAPHEHDHGVATIAQRPTTFQRFAEAFGPIRELLLGWRVEIHLQIVDQRN